MLYYWCFSCRFFMPNFNSYDLLYVILWQCQDAVCFSLAYKQTKLSIFLISYIWWWLGNMDNLLECDHKYLSYFSKQPSNCNVDTGLLLCLMLCIYYHRFRKRQIILFLDKLYILQMLCYILYLPGTYIFSRCMCPGDYFSHSDIFLYIISKSAIQIQFYYHDIMAFGWWLSNEFPLFC